jgi:hypothetical protein
MLEVKGFKTFQLNEHIAVARGSEIRNEVQYVRVLRVRAERDGDKRKNWHLKTNLSTAESRCCVLLYFSLQRKQSEYKIGRSRFHPHSIYIFRTTETESDEHLCC